MFFTFSLLLYESLFFYAFLMRTSRQSQYSKRVPHSFIPAIHALAQFVATAALKNHVFDKFMDHDIFQTYSYQVSYTRDILCTNLV